jgi:hypothetical protein
VLDEYTLADLLVEPDVLLALLATESGERALA